MTAIRNLLEAQEGCRNVHDLLTRNQAEEDAACLEIVWGLVAYIRERQLSRQQAQQEELWKAERGSAMGLPLLVLACAGLATFATVCGWFWWAGMLAVGVCALGYLMILAEEEGEGKCQR